MKVSRNASDMVLTMGTFNIKNIVLSDKNDIRDGTLYVDEKGLVEFIMKDPVIASCKVDLVFPGEKTRILRVVDAVEPRYKPGAAQPFAGQGAPVEQLGYGETFRCANVGVLLSAQIPLRRAGGLHINRETIIDMVGPGAHVNVYPQLMNIVVSITVHDDFDEFQYEQACRFATANAGRYIGLAMKDKTPDKIEVFDMNAPCDPTLPKVVCAYQVHAVGLYYTSYNYGLSYAGLLPTLMHPNEILDGAIFSCNYGCPSTRAGTYQHINSPILRELYARHGKTINFSGVILFRGRFEEMEGKRRVANQVAKMAQMLGAQGSVNCWEGEGNAFIETMLTVKQLENRGIKTVLITSELGGNEGRDNSLFYSEPEADAIVSCGSWQRPITLPPVERVVGAGDHFARLQPENGLIEFDGYGEIKLWQIYEVCESSNKYGLTGWSCDEF